MKKPLIFLTIILFSILSFAQNTHIDYKYAIKIYNTSSYDLNYDFGNTKTLEINFFHPSIALQKSTKKNNFHEIELSNIKLFTKDVQRENTNIIPPQYQETNVTSSEGALKYEFIIPFAKKQDRKLVPSIGFGVNPYFTFDKYVPLLSSSFSSSHRLFGFKLYAANRLTYYFSKRFFIDMNIPLFIDVAEYKIIKTDNPTIPKEDRKNTYRDILEKDPYFNVRLGLGIKL